MKRDEAIDFLLGKSKPTAQECVRLLRGIADILERLPVDAEGNFYERYMGVVGEPGLRDQLRDSLAGVLAAEQAKEAEDDE